MKSIPLSNSNLEAIVDDDIYNLVNLRKLSLSNCGYVQGELYGYRCLHRYVMTAPKGQEVDHINRNKLDNRRSNLRFVTRSQNMHNVACRGCTYVPKKQKWQSQLKHNGRQYYLGLYTTEAEARQAYLIFKKEHFD